MCRESSMGQKLRLKTAQFFYTQLCILSERSNTIICSSQTHSSDCQHPPAVQTSCL